MSEVTEIYAVLTTDKDGREGIPAMTGKREDGQITTTPIVGTDREHMVRLWPSVKDDLKKHFGAVKFVKFTGMEIIEETKP